MRPEFEPGDRLLVDPSVRVRPVARGDVIVLRDPEDRRRLLLKRVAALAGEPVPVAPVPGDDSDVPPLHLYVLSDQRSGTRDSRRFGAVPLSAIVGRVWFRYAPPARQGPVPP